MTDCQVWVASKTLAWEVADVIEIKDEEITVKTREGITKLSKSKVFSTDPTHFEDTEDLCSMNRLHEAPLLDVLRRRFKANNIYTTTGDVLISINPYKTIPGLYDCKEDYLTSSSESTKVTKPHVYKIANYAFENSKGSKAGYSPNKNQSIVVSGESGAGKTEASKHVMNFLINADKDTTSATDPHYELNKKIGVEVGKVLVESNVIFEAFGNAKTVRNDNSSRFGKYIKLQYSEERRIISAFTETFLLEKSRLVNISANERNYHVFYQFLRGNKNKELSDTLKLAPPENFKMLCDTNGIANQSSEDINFDELSHALSTLGCTEKEVTSLWTVLAGILHLGNITCNTNEQGKVTIDSPSMSKNELCALLGIPEMFFDRNLTLQKVKAGSRSSVSLKVLTAVDVSNNILALLKWMYSCLFSWLVKKINYKHCSVSSELPNAHVVNFIGILDIFGFEILQTNSFEQLCINFTNERLQQQFNEYVFDREQEIYRSEGLDWTTINYKDNQDVIDLIGKKPTGILTILEEQGMLNRGGADESALLNAIIQTHEKSSTFAKSRFTNDGKFIVKHFAGEVTYCIFGFLEKNNDSLQDDLLELMLCSTDPFIQNAIVAVGMEKPSTPDTVGYIGNINPSMIVPSAGNIPIVTPSEGSTIVPTESKRVSAGRRLANEGGGKKLATTVTVSFQFRTQLDTLLITLRATSLHYIKCIKPNGLKVPETFDSHMVLEQLRYSGALEVVRIRQEGFPIAITFVAYYATFEILSFNRGWLLPSECNEEQAKEYARILSSEVLTKLDFQIGNTKIFLRTSAYEDMLKAIKIFLGKKVSKFQCLIRGINTRKWFRVVKNRFILLQAQWRMHSRKKWYKIKLAEIAAARTKEQERLAEIERKRQLELAAKLKEEKRLAEIERLKELARVEAERQAKLAAEEAERQARLAAEEAKRKADEEKRVLNLRVSKLQAIVRKFKCKRNFKLNRKRIILLQSIIRMFIQRRRYKKTLKKNKEQKWLLLNKRVSQLQAVIRRIKPHKNFRILVKGIRFLQSYVRMKIMRGWYIRTIADMKERARLAKIAEEEAKEEAERLAEIERLREAQRIAKAAAEEQARLERAERAEAARLARIAQEEEERIARQQAEELEQQKKNHFEQCVIKVQSIGRRKIAIDRLYKMLRGFRALQTVVRMRPWRLWFLGMLAYNAEVARLEYEEKIRKITKFQSIVRMKINFNRFRIIIDGVIRLQSVARMKQQRRIYLSDIQVERSRIAEEKRLAQLAAEEEARKLEEARLAEIERVKELARIEAARVKALEEEKKLRDKEEKERLAKLAKEEAERLEKIKAEELRIQKIIKVQSIARRNIARYHFHVAMKGIIYLQSYVRMKPWRAWFQSTLAYNNELLRLAEEDLFYKISKLQSLVRMKIERKKYKTTCRGVVFLQSYVRMKLSRNWLQRTLRSIEEAKIRAQQAYEDRIQGLHCACRVANISLVKILLQANPQDYDVVDSKHKNCTVLHSACYSGNVDLISYLNPRMEEFNILDSEGNIAIHYNAMSPGSHNKTKVQLFKHIISIFEPQSTVMATSEKVSSVRPELKSTRSLHRIDSVKTLLREVDNISAKLESTVNKIADPSNNRVLKSGWLKKRGESQAWQKRWVVLTPENLSYYSNDKDLKTPRDSISFSAKNIIIINRLDADMSTGIDIVMRHGNTTLTKKRNRVSLFAETEMEIQEWINMLKLCAGVESNFTSQASKVSYVSPAVRQAILNQYNTNGDSVLHLLCNCENGDTNENFDAVSWALSNGSATNVINRQGRSPVQCAKLSGNVKLTSLLTVRGSSKRENCFLEAPPRLRNFHYISFLFSRQIVDPSIIGEGSGTQFLLTVSVYNGNNHLVEATQTTQSFEVINNNMIVWSDMCYIQIPFENVGNDAFVLFEVKAKGSNQTVCWMHFQLNKSTLDSKTITLPQYTTPVIVSAMPPATSSGRVTEVEMMVTRRTGMESSINMM